RGHAARRQLEASSARRAGAARSRRQHRARRARADHRALSVEAVASKGPVDVEGRRGAARLARRRQPGQGGLDGFAQAPRSVADALISSEAMTRIYQCRRAEAGLAGAGGDALPFVLPGARATFTPAREVNVRHLRIEVALDFAAAAVDGVTTLTLVPLADGRARVALDAVEMQLHAVTLADGAALDYSYDGAKVAFELAGCKEGAPVDVVVRYRCTPRRGLYFIRPDEQYPARPTQAWSQGQDEDNRGWFPCFDHPNVKSTSEVIATVPK